MLASLRTVWAACLCSLPFHRRFQAKGESLLSVFDVPDVLPRRTAFLVAKNQCNQWLVFDCPCPARHRVMLNLDFQTKPVWRLIEERPLTLYPSVDERTKHGRCHYLINKGKVVWV